MSRVRSILVSTALAIFLTTVLSVGAIAEVTRTETRTYVWTAAAEFNNGGCLPGGAPCFEPNPDEAAVELAAEDATGLDTGWYVYFCGDFADSYCEATDPFCGSKTLQIPDGTDYFQVVAADPGVHPVVPDHECLMPAPTVGTLSATFTN